MKRNSNMVTRPNK